MRLNFQKIELRRKKMGLRQYQFAELMGLKQSRYAHIKRGTRKASLEFIENLYLKAGLKFSEIFIIEVE